MSQMTDTNKSMQNQPTVMAIDIGTTSAKGLLVSADGTVITSTQKFYNTTFSSMGLAEQDPDLIVQSVFDYS